MTAEGASLKEALPGVKKNKPHEDLGVEGGYVSVCVCVVVVVVVVVVAVVVVVVVVVVET